MLPEAPALHRPPLDPNHCLPQAQALSGQAKRAELYREEAEALRERAGRLPRLQDELRRCRERLQVAESYKGRLEVGELRGAGPRGVGAGPKEAWSF